jgi:hypothetical protein
MNLRFPLPTMLFAIACACSETERFPLVKTIDGNFLFSWTAPAFAGPTS